MSVNVQTSLDQHGLTADEQMAVFAYMNRSQQVNAYEVQQHIAVRFERRGFFAVSYTHLTLPTTPYV